MEQELEIEFGWDETKLKITREPSPPLCDDKENIRLAGLMVDIQGKAKDRKGLQLVGEPSLTRDRGEYEMALYTFEQRHWYQPIRRMIGNGIPPFVSNAGPDDYNSVREGIHTKRSLGADRLQKALAEDVDVQRASRFQEYAYRVSETESYNESCCRALLYAYAMLVKHNPEGDAEKIDTLRGLLSVWYDIEHPGPDRIAQARQATKNLRWLSPPWRAVWGRP